MERIDRNYAEYKEKVTAYGCEYVFENAAEAAAVKEVYLIIKAIKWPDEEIAAYLLKFRNPLMMLAEEWRGYLTENGPDFEDFTDNFIVFNATSSKNYALKDDALYSRHSITFPINKELLTEMIDLCEKYFNIDLSGFLNINNSGEDGFWNKG